ncbi:MAG: M23 family metallopeptidase [Bacteroidales bacterium]
MAKIRKYKFNRETLIYEPAKGSLLSKLRRALLYFLFSIALSSLYFFAYTSLFKLESPKYLLLKRENEQWLNRLYLLNSKLQRVEEALSIFEIRDNNLYRPIFGMDEIPEDYRKSGFGGVERYSYLRNFDRSGLLIKSANRLDLISKRAYLQSSSFDDLTLLANDVDKMTFCVPAIPPVNIGSKDIRYSSSFGYRRDPFKKEFRLHTGVDLAGPLGESIYATGNGKVIQIGYDYFGYGKFLIIDHGFGYKTKYAHLKSALVAIGDSVERGDIIAHMGNSGRSTGAHLHYEIIYRNRVVNPLNYFNIDVSEEQFLTLINHYNDNEQVSIQ